MWRRRERRDGRRAQPVQPRNRRGRGEAGGTTGAAGSTARGGTTGTRRNCGGATHRHRRDDRRRGNNRARRHDRRRRTRDGSAGTTGTAGAGGAGSPPVSKYIVVDQFGYLPDLEKVAVIRDPQTGFDAAESFTPGATYALVNAATGARVFMAAPTTWNGGATDASSGDKAWWFTFTSITTAGDYYVLDVDKNVRSYTFTIGDTVYRDVLKQAVRMLFYQRAGQAKDAAHAGAGWTDAASFTGALQDQHCRLFSDKNNAATERDLRGGWYDAGDFNKYTSWTAGYVETLLRAYAENPTIWTDDTNIPESGNGIPDVLDEAKWGLDFLVRMQSTDGSVLSIVGEPAASPPSAATGQSLYGPANTSATLATAAAFAAGARILKLPNNAALNTAATDLLARAKTAWTWAVANPNVQFKNNDSASGSSGLGSGPARDRRLRPPRLQAGRRGAAVRRDRRRDVQDVLRRQLQPASPDQLQQLRVAVGRAGAGRGARLRGRRGRDGGDRDRDSQRVPRPAPRAAATWARSRATRSVPRVHEGLRLGVELDEVGGRQHLRGGRQPQAGRGVERRHDAGGVALHPLHPRHEPALARLPDEHVRHGAENCANEMFHTWFADGSAMWDRAGTSTYGPPPGYLTGGANPGYDWDGCCPSNCGGAANNAICTSMSISPPRGNPRRSRTRTSTPPGPWIRGASPSRATATRWRTSACCRSSFR